MQSAKHDRVSVCQEQLKKDEQRQRKRESSLRSRILSRMGQGLKVIGYVRMRR